MDVSEELKQAENAIRNLLHHLLSKQHGSEWHDKCGLSAERVDRWRERREIERKQRGHHDPRLIYYSDFHDLYPIISKNWNTDLASVFKEKKRVEVFLSILETMRNPDAHRRTLMPHEEHLIAGITGAIRASISRYFSLMDTTESYYVKIELAQDNLGNSIHAGGRSTLATPNRLRPGDELTFKISASDPLDEEITYGIAINNYPVNVQWNTTGVFRVLIEDEHVVERLWIHIAVKSPRQFAAKREAHLGKVDDVVKFGYEVLPLRP